MKILLDTDITSYIFAHRDERPRKRFVACADTPIGSLDMLIAAHAVALDVPLVTNNAREFRRTSGLRVENWLV